MMKNKNDFNNWKKSHLKDPYIIDSPPTVQKIPKRIVTILPKIITNFEGLGRLGFFVLQNSAAAFAFKKPIFINPTQNTLLNISKINGFAQKVNLVA